MGDQLARLCRRGSTKIPNYVLPSISSAIEQGRPSSLLVLAVAGWLRFLRGSDYAGDPVPVEGPRKEQLVRLAQEAGDDAGPLLRVHAVFGDSGADPRFYEPVRDAVLALSRSGPREVLEQYLSAPAAAA